MGCWNKTCGLSNLPITAGKEAYVFVLEKSESDDHCYATHLYKPLLLPFVTEYNDYGGGENSSGPGFDHIMDAVKKNLHEMEVGDNKYHDIAIKKDNFDEALFFEAVHEGRLFREGHYSDPVKLEYVMFRKDIVDDILTSRVVEQYVGDGKGTCGWDNNYIQYKFKDIVADILPLIQELFEKLQNENDSLASYMLDMDMLFKYDHPNKAARWLRGDTYRYSRIVDVKGVMRELLKDATLNSVIKLEAFLTEYLKGVFIDNFMEVTRKSWIPAGHEGSQSQEFDEYRLLIGAMNKVMDAEDAYWKEMNGEEEEA